MSYIYIYIYYIAIIDILFLPASREWNQEPCSRTPFRLRAARCVRSVRCGGESTRSRKCNRRSGTRWRRGSTVCGSQFRYYRRKMTNVAEACYTFYPPCSYTCLFCTSLRMAHLIARLQAAITCFLARSRKHVARSGRQRCIRMLIIQLTTVPISDRSQHIHQLYQLSVPRQADVF